MYDCSQITERLYCGSQIRSGEDIRDLINRGVTHLIDCCIERDDRIYLSGDVPIALLSAATADDGQPKGRNWFEPAIDFALGALAHPNHIVHAHCAAGVNRGPSMIYAIMRAQGWPADLAFNQLTYKRPVCHGGVVYRSDAERVLVQLGWTRS